MRCCALKNFANLIVRGHKVILVLMIILCVGCALLIPSVEINTDMTKYLPDDSSMKQGVDVMMEDFTSMAMSQTIRVMFEDLTDEEKVQIRNQLENIEYVDSVSYIENSEDYNKDNYTKFVVNTSYTYGSPEELSIEKAIEEQFEDYKMNYMNDNTSSMELPWLIIVVALVILFAILFLMSSSWFEPVLFMVTIGVAVAINMGTNVVLGSVSQITMSIAAILQLVLSMDYSIILANRYRQEKLLCDDIEEAMKNAWKNAFSSIMSSGMTTVIGLTMLVFMSFKIGMDLGLVLAKGVLCSMICVLTVLPSLLLIFDEKIEDTEKNELHLPMGLVSKIQYKIRKPLAIFFAILFVVTAVLQNTTKIVYSISPEDPIADVFTPSNPIILLYNNEDEENANKVIAEFENKDVVKNIMSYSNTLGKKYSSNGIMSMIDDMGIPMTIDSSLIDLVYYSYFNGDKTLPMSISQVVNFIKYNVMSNDMFSSFISGDMQNSIDKMELFANAQNLTTPMMAEEIASSFSMDASQVKQLMVLYFGEKGGADCGTMSLPTFADFVVNEVSKNPTYSQMFDAETKSQLSMLTTFTNKDAVTEKRHYDSMSQIMGVDVEKIKLFYAYHKVYSQNPEVVDYEQVMSEYLAMQIIGSEYKLSIQEFLNFIMDNKEMMSSAMTPEDLEKLTMGHEIVNGTVKGTLYSPEGLAKVMNMEPAQLRQLYLLYICEHGDTSGWKVSIQNFINFIISDVLPNKAYASQFDAETADMLKGVKKLIDAAVSGKAYSSTELATMFGALTDQIDNNTMEALCLYYSSTQETSGDWKLTIEEMFNYVSNDLLNDQRFSNLIDSATRQQVYDMKTTLDSAINQLLGENHSLMMIETSLPIESTETTAFMDELSVFCGDNLTNKYYFIGNTPMSYEMEQSFDKELLFITLLTVAAIFIVVALTFRSLSIPALLVLLVQCGVYLTMTVNGLMGYSIYYLALLIVQCILMGATIDYAILFTNYYRESRKTMDIKDSIKAAYEGSIHTILTSGLIMIVVTGAIGLSPVDPTIAQICQTISIGALSATLLILFVLPGVAAALDKFTNKQKKDKTE